ncbi:hypothetical protein PSN45_003950 [Yamadazyma tenuis]|nr:hypothetical protein PSN45_003950 [Yamadazyma tenuis]
MSHENANSMVTELVRLLNVDEVDDVTLQLCIKLLDQGVDPKQLARDILSIKNETTSAIS